MGVDCDSKLIVGWYVDTNKLKSWILSKNFCNCEKEKDGVTPKKDRKGKPKVCMNTGCWEMKIDEHLCPGLNFTFAGNMYIEEEIEYYLILNEAESEFTITSINELFDKCKDAILFGKKLAKELSYETEEEQAEEEPTIFAVKYIW